MREFERAIILLLLSSEGGQPCSRARLAEELGAELQTIERALAQLAEAGVVGLEGEEVVATRAVRVIDELGLISI
jgi:DNA-binding IscR family transcriptional regulator